MSLKNTGNKLGLSESTLSEIVRWQQESGQEVRKAQKRKELELVGKPVPTELLPILVRPMAKEADREFARAAAEARLQARHELVAK